jgi:hypothetical protein
VGSAGRKYGEATARILHRRPHGGLAVGAGTVDGMFVFSSLELWVRIRRGGDADGWAMPGRVVGLRLRSDPAEQHGRLWQWVVDVDPGSPALSDVLANCHDFLVDDDCGRAVGVVEDVGVDPYSAVPVRLLVVQGWGRQRTTVSADDVIGVAPGGRRLVITCRTGHRTRQARPARGGPWKPADTAGKVWSSVAWLAGGRIKRAQRR